MSSKQARQCLLVASLLGVLAAIAATTAGAATPEQETAAHIERLRAIKKGQSDATRATYNQQMDAGWKFYSSHKPEILPILRAQLKAQINREQPIDLVLLDLGFFLRHNDGPDGKALARDALFRLNPRAAIINENWKELSKIHSGIQTMSLGMIRSALASLPGDKKLADTKVIARLDAVIANDGKDERTSPLAILDSGLNADSLIASLLKVRSLLLYRLSDEALSDVEVTNSLVTALRYRGH